MTNDHSLKGFWPPEAKVMVDLDLGFRLTKSANNYKMVLLADFFQE